MSENQITPGLGARLFALFAAATVVSFAAIIAGVPINVPHNQNDAQPTSQIFAGYNAWQIVATAFVFALAPALTYAYGTLHGLNLSDLLRNVTVVVSLISFLWILFSFSLAYGKDAKNNGILGYPATFYFFYHTQDQVADLNNAPNISNTIFAVYELGFAIVTAVLVTISLAGRVNLNSFLIFIFAWHLVVYTPVAHIVWTPSGALYTNWVQDFSGALVVHILSSTTSLALHLLLGKDEIRRAAPVADSEGALTYTFVVWFLWFGFNAGKAYNSGPVATQSVVNTIAATYISVLIAYFYNTILDKPLTQVSVSNAILIGVVGITPASGFVTVGGALVIAIFTYLFTTVVANFFLNEGSGVNESLSTLSIHSIAGTVGFVWTAILSYEFVNPDGYNGLTYGRGITLSYQLVGLVVIWVGSFISNFILAWLVNLWAPLKNVENHWAPQEQEQQQQGEVEGEQNKAV